MRLMRSSDWNHRGRRAVPPAGPLPWVPRVVAAGGSGCGAVGCIWLRMSIQSSPSALYPHWLVGASSASVCSSPIPQVESTVASAM
eukprot:5882199-Prymnesium_polylepis.1